MPKSGDDDDDNLPGDVTDPGYVPGRPTETDVGERPRDRTGSRSGKPPERTGSRSGPRPERTGSQSGPRPERTVSRSGPRPERTGSRSGPRSEGSGTGSKTAGVEPEANDDDWGSYDDSGEAWDVTSAHVRHGTATGSVHGSTREMQLAKPPPQPPGEVTGSPLSTDGPAPEQTGSGPKPEPSLRRSQIIFDDANMPAGRLEGIKGADAGRTFTLDREEIVVGRDPKCTYVLQDPSASREHARILRDESGYVLVDNSSGNGTYVNGKRVERSRLQTGDEVAFGQAQFKFMAGGEVYRPPVALEVSRVPQVPRWRQRLPITASVSIGAVGLLALLIWQAQTSSSRGRAQVFEHYKAGVSAFNDHQWDVAENEFTAVLRTDGNHVRGKRYLRAVAVQREAEVQLSNAETTCRSTDLAGCVVQVTPLLNTMFRRDAAELLRSVDNVLEQQVARAQSALDEGDVPVATYALQSVEAVHPGRPDVAALLTRASQTPAKPPPKIRVPKERWPQAGPVAEAIRAFVEGDVNGARAAVEKAQSDDADKLRTLLNQFRDAYDNALAQHRGKRAFQAIRLFTQAKGIEAKISGGQSKLVAGINTKLADMYYVLGMEAYLGSKLPEAADDFRTALGLSPDHALSQHKLKELQDKAQVLFDDAQQLRQSDTSKARSNLETVVEMLTPKDELYRKAQSRLSGLKQ